MMTSSMPSPESRGSVWRIAAVGAAAAVVSCYPIVFCGKSFVSPLDGGMPMLYSAPPYVPGSVERQVQPVPDTDLGAAMHQNVPYSVMQYRAIVLDHEWPLWDRYNACGVPLLGQGQSMFGHPLHWLTMLSGGAAWAWDLRFVEEKALFCSAIGLLVWMATGSAGAAMVMACSAAYMGFFLFRFSHGAFLTLCDAPWILIGWLGLARARGRHAVARWSAALLMADWMVLTSGTMKEAAVDVAVMNAWGALATATGAGAARRQTFLSAAWASLIFLALSSPLWTVFLTTLRHAKTAYRNEAWTIPATLLPGIFDVAFFRSCRVYLGVAEPSGNGLILGGVACALVQQRRWRAAALYRSSAMAAIAIGTVGFGAVPPALLARLPLVSQIGHIDDVAASILLVPLLVFAGFGVAGCLAPERPGGDPAMRRAGPVLLFALLVWHLATFPSLHRELVHLGTIPPATVPVRDTAFWLHLAGLFAALWLLPWSLTGLAKARVMTRLVFAGVFLWLHAPYGLFGPLPLSMNVVQPGIRVRLDGRSPALDRLARQDSPGRAVGFEAALFPGYTALAGIEGISGPPALRNPKYEELLAAAGIEQVWYWRHVLHAPVLGRIHRVLDALNVTRYVAMPESVGAVPGKGLQLEAKLDLDLYRSPTAWPRAFFTDAIRPIRGAEDLVALLAAGDGRPFAAMDPVDLADAFTLPGQERLDDVRRVVAATDYRMTGNSTSFSVYAPCAGLAVLTEAWVPGDLHATVNGVPVPCLRVNHAFRGVPIPGPGAWRVVVTYRPAMFDAALGAAAVAMVAFLFWLARAGAFPRDAVSRP